MPTFDVRPACDSDRESILALIGKWVPGSPAARFDWLYRSNPHGRALTWIAFESESGEPAACTSMFPRRVRVAGRERIGAIGGDCFVEPKFRRLGLATTLHRQSMREMRERGVDFMFGPPVSRNLGALMKAGSRLVTRYVRWGRQLTAPASHPGPAPGIHAQGRKRFSNAYLRTLDWIGRGDTRGFTIEQVEHFGVEFEVLAHSLAAPDAVVCLRDREYLEWRYKAAPSRAQTPLAIRRNGALVAFAALEMQARSAQVFDLAGLPETRVLDATIGLLVRHAALAGARDLEVCMTAGSRTAQRLWRSGFAMRCENGFQVAGAGQDPQAAVLLAADPWHFTAADQDVDSAFAPTRAEPSE